MREGWARGTWGRVQPLSGTFCCSRVQPRAASRRDHMHQVVPIEFECSHVLLKESLGAAMSLCHDALAFRLISQSEPSRLRPLLDGLCRCVSMVVIVAQLDGPPFVE